MSPNDTDESKKKMADEKKVVKICNTSDEASLAAAYNEVAILQELPPHANIVRYFEHYFNEETG